MDYQENDGILYPMIKISEENEPIGKYGYMALKYLHDEHLKRYDFLLASGELMKIIKQVDEEAYERMEVLTTRMLKEKPLTDPTDTILSWQEKEQIRSIAEEMVLKEIVYRIR